MSDSITYGFAIETRYHGPTNFKGARISARLTDGADRCFKPIFIPYPHELSGRDAHIPAALKLIEKWDDIRADGKFLPLKLIASAGSDRGYIFMAV